MVVPSVPYILLHLKIKGHEQYTRSLYLIPITIFRRRFDEPISPNNVYARENAALCNQIMDTHGLLFGTFVLLFILAIFYLFPPLQYYFLSEILLFYCPTIKILRYEVKINNNNTKYKQNKSKNNNKPPKRELEIILLINPPPVITDASLKATLFTTNIDLLKPTGFAMHVEWKVVEAEDFSQEAFDTSKDCGNLTFRDQKCPKFLRGYAQMLDDECFAIKYHDMEEIEKEISAEFAQIHEIVDRDASIPKAVTFPPDPYNDAYHRIFSVVEQHAHFSTRERLLMLSLCKISFKIFYPNTVISGREFVHPAGKLGQKICEGSEKYQNIRNEKGGFTIKLLHLYAYNYNLRALSFALSPSLSLASQIINEPSPSSFSPPLHFANISDEIEFLLACGADVNARDIFGFTELHHAVVAQGDNKLRLVEVLLRWGAQINACDAHGNSPLSYLCPSSSSSPSSACGDLACAELLLKCGASLSQENVKGISVMTKISKKGNLSVEMEQLFKRYLDSVLFDAAQEGDVEEVRRVGKKEIVDRIVQHGLAPIHIAAVKGHVEILEELVKLGANVNLCSGITGDTALHMAMKQPKVELVLKLIELGADINAYNKAGKTPLCFAVAEDRPLFAEVLLNAGAFVDGGDDAEEPPLHSVNSVEVLHIMVAAGANIRDVASNQTTVLHTTKSPAVAEELLRLDPQLLKVPGKQGWTPLLSACEVGREDIAAVLLRAGANVNTMDVARYTPLIVALLHKHYKVVETLLPYGVNVHHASDFYAPLDMAVKDGNIEIVEMLLDFGFNVNKKAISQWSHFPIFSAIRCSKTENDPMVKLLIDRGADVHLPGLIHEAAKSSTVFPLEYLILHGADVNETSEKGVTPLHSSVRLGQEKIARILVKNGAKVNAVTTKGRNPLHFACSAGDDVAVQELLILGADFLAKDYKGQTPLHRAYNHYVVKALVLGTKKRVKEKEEQGEREEEEEKEQDEEHEKEEVGEKDEEKYKKVEHKDKAEEDKDEEDEKENEEKEKRKASKRARARGKDLPVWEEDDSGNTPLHIFIQQQLPECVQILLECAPINLEDVPYFLQLAEKVGCAKIEKAFHEWESNQRFKHKLGSFKSHYSNQDDNIEPYPYTYKPPKSATEKEQ